MPFENTPRALNAVHAALVPAGPHRGHVLVWEFGVPGRTGFLRWGIVDPEARRTVFEATEPNPAGELFCSGHAWTRDGRLFVAGGWNFGSGVGASAGSLEAWIFDPTLADFPDGKWIRQPRLLRGRYYPTVVASGDSDDRMLVLGGGPSLNTYAVDDWDDYEVFVPAPPGASSQGRWETRVDAAGETTRSFPGPSEQGAASLARFFQYPRVHVDADGVLFVAGMSLPGLRARFPTDAVADWLVTSSQDRLRYYGCSVRMRTSPEQPAPAVVALGGLDPFPPPPTDPYVALATVVRCNPRADAPGSWPGGWSWSSLPDLVRARGCANVVVLPNGDLLAIGGQSGHPLGGATYSTAPELFHDGAWRMLTAEPSRRGYHATALLLPSGKVFSAGSNVRDHDYTVFVPPAQACGTPPLWGQDAPPEMPGYGREVTLVVSADSVPVREVVLARPGSTTHHFDPDLRVVALATRPGRPGEWFVRMPQSPLLAPPGWWMVFLVGSDGACSEARWLRL